MASTFEISKRYIIDQICKLPSFAGELNREESEKRLKGCSPGTFLVRYSQNYGKRYLIVLVTEKQNEIQHLKIELEYLLNLSRWQVKKAFTTWYSVPSSLHCICNFALHSNHSVFAQIYLFKTREFQTLPELFTFYSVHSGLFEMNSDVFSTRDILKQYINPETKALIPMKNGKCDLHIPLVCQFDPFFYCLFFPSDLTKLSLTTCPLPSNVRCVCEAPHKETSKPNN